MRAPRMAGRRFLLGRAWRSSSLPRSVAADERFDCRTGQVQGGVAFRKHSPIAARLILYWKDCHFTVQGGTPYNSARRPNLNPIGVVRLLAHSSANCPPVPSTP